MTEPVAYMWKTVQGTITGLAPNDNSHSGGRLGIPLYTADQLHPRVKMTQAERVELNKLFLSSAVTIYEVMDTIYKDNGKMNEFSHLYQHLFNRNDKLELENQLEFSKLWANFNIENQEATIEIIPDMKWFVRSKEKSSGQFWYLKKTEHFFFHEYIKEISTQFDTKEEAEKWTNPLTEAVQLPVEGE